MPKLERIEPFREIRSALAERYDAGLASLPGITPLLRPDFGRHAYHLYVVRIDPALAGADRDAYAAALRAENISTGLHFLPVHQLSWYRDNVASPALPATELAGAQVLSLPLSGAHTPDDVDDALAAVHKLHTAFTA